MKAQMTFKGTIVKLCCPSYLPVRELAPIGLSRVKCDQIDRMNWCSYALRYNDKRPY
jgi:hypothetical protein